MVDMQHEKPYNTTVMKFEIKLKLKKHMILKLRVETCEECSLEEIQIVRPVNMKISSLL